MALGMRGQENKMLRIGRKWREEGIYDLMRYDHRIP